MNKTFLNQLNVRQNFLLKTILGIRNHARFKPLLHELKVDQISQLYFKHKIFGFKQICLNDFSYSIFTYLNNLKIKKKGNTLDKKTYIIVRLVVFEHHRRSKVKRSYFIKLKKIFK